MDLNFEIMKIASQYVRSLDIKPNHFKKGDIISMLNHTRDTTILYAELLQICNNDSVLVCYYKELIESINLEDYIKASEYKNKIIKHVSNI